MSLVGVFSPQYPASVPVSRGRTWVRWSDNCPAFVCYVVVVGNRCTTVMIANTTRGEGGGGVVYLGGQGYLVIKRWGEVAEDFTNRERHLLPNGVPGAEPSAATNTLCARCGRDHRQRIKSPRACLQYLLFSNVLNWGVGVYMKTLWFRLL